MKAIVAVGVVLSENRAEGPVRPVYQADGCGSSRDAPRASNVASGGGTPRRKTALPGPSPAGEWMLCGSVAIARTSRTSLRTATSRPQSPGLITEQNDASANEAVSK
jgi:hypothetical protein